MQRNSYHTCITLHVVNAPHYQFSQTRLVSPDGPVYEVISPVHEVVHVDI